jgi:hypothetical protein
MLPLGVNVQDVFKHKALFSKFTISSATTSPLRLLGSRLENSEVFQAEGGGPLLQPLMIFPRQPASMLYKITKIQPKSGFDPSAPKKKALLSLVLNYICLDEEIENAVTQDLHQAFEHSPLHPFTRLVIPTVVTQLLTLLSSYDMEHTAVLGEFSTSALSSIRWRDHFSGLGCGLDQEQDIAIKLEEFLQEWQRQKPSLPLIPVSITEDSINTSRSIIIPVDIPSVSVVHTADLKIVDPSPFSSNITVAALNQPISTSLAIKWTRIWDSKKPVDSQDSDLEFFYEVSAASDTWLVGGKRKGHFKVPRNVQSLDSKHKLSFPVVLIPLREGYLPFPIVDIKPAPLPKVIGPGGLEEVVKQPVLTCETDFKNAAETIRGSSSFFLVISTD